MVAAMGPPYDTCSLEGPMDTQKTRFYMVAAMGLPYDTCSLEGPMDTQKSYYMWFDTSYDLFLEIVG